MTDAYDPTDQDLRTAHLAEKAADAFLALIAADRQVAAMLIDIYGLELIEEGWQNALSNTREAAKACTGKLTPQNKFYALEALLSDTASIQASERQVKRLFASLWKAMPVDWRRAFRDRLDENCEIAAPKKPQHHIDKEEMELIEAIRIWPAIQKTLERESFQFKFGLSIGRARKMEGWFPSAKQKKQILLIYRDWLEAAAGEVELVE